MKHENTRALYKYWNTLRAGRAAPFRREVDPRAIEGLLDSTFILEHIDERSSRFRLAGTKLCDHFGMELRGMSALALWHGDCRERARDVLNHVVRDPCIGYVSCTVETRDRRLFDAEFLYLPLKSDFGDVSRILGCGYYMNGFSGAVRAHEPLHHWIDDTRLYAIKAVAEDVEPPQIDRHRPLRDAIKVLETQLSDHIPGPKRARLKTIEGGRRAGLPIGIERPAPEQRSRDHLKLVE